MNALKIIRTGPCTSIQDLGRPGYLNRGVSGSGAMDPVSHRLANALVANEANAATIEFASYGGVFEVTGQSAAFAVTGVEVAILVNDVPHSTRQTIFAEQGDTISISTATRGNYGYLAIAGGGVQIAPVFGSRSTHLRTRLGGLEGRALKAGDMVPIADQAPQDLAPLRLGAEMRDENGPVRVTLGPQDDLFTEAGIETFLSQPYVVTEMRDRMAQVLEGPQIEHRDSFNIVSDAIARGSIQVAGNRVPMVLLAERQTTGGYPKIATVISADIHRFAQLPVGDQVRFEAVDVAQAEAGARLLETRIEETIGTIEAAPQATALSSEWLLRNNLIDGVFVHGH